MRRWCLFVLALLPGLYVTQLIARYGVNVPYADEFTLAPFFVKAHDHSLTVSDLFAQHNEHRYFFTNMLFIAIGFAAHGDVRAEMFFSVVLAALSSLNLWFLLRKTAPLSIEQRLFVLFLFNLFLFSPAQAENWTWGFQFVLLFCNYLATCGILAAFSSLALPRKVVICAALAVVANFSFGAGALLWAVTFPLALLAPTRMSWKSRMAWAFAWGTVALGAIALYFFEYVKPPFHPTIAASTNPLDYFFYVTTFLGAHLSRAAPALVGSILLILWCTGVAYAFRFRRDSDLTRRMLPWFALGGYALLNALLAAAARIGFGINQALDSRYTSFSLYLSVATLGLCAILKQDLSSQTKSRRLENAVLRFEAALLTAVAVFSLTAFSWGRTFMSDIHASRLLGKGALLFSNVLDSAELHDRYLVANAPEARAYANMLDKIGLLHPPMIRTAEISKLNAKGGRETGFFDYITVSGQSCVAVGWAILPKTRTRAHCVVLSYEDPVRGAIAFRIADETQKRPDVARVLHEPLAEASGWICHFDRSLLPPGNLLLTAWAFDANRAILYELGTPRVLH